MWEKFPDYSNVENSWKIINGDEYINLLVSHSIIPASSAIVSNWEVLKNLGGFQYPFCLDESMSIPMGFQSDEGYCHQFLLSSIGSVAVTNKVIGVRGRPSEAYSRSTVWRKDIGQVQFLLMYNVYKADLKGKYSDIVKKKAKEWIFIWPVRRIILNMIKHYNYNPEVIYLYFKSYAVYRLLGHPKGGDRTDF